MGNGLSTYEITQDDREWQIETQQGQADRRIALERSVLRGHGPSLQWPAPPADPKKMTSLAEKEGRRLFSRVFGDIIGSVPTHPSRVLAVCLVDGQS